MDREAGYGSRADYAVVFHGTLINGTTGSIDLDGASVPRVQALDANGFDRIGYTMGAYDQSPAPGKPRADKVTVVPGASITFATNPLTMSATELSAVRYWYTDTESYPSALLATFTDPAAFTYCHVGRDSSGGGTSLPNPYH